MKKILSLVLALSLILCLAACGSKNDDSETKAEADGDEKVTIGYSPYTLTNEYFTAILKGVETACEELDYELVCYDPQNDATTQATQIEDMISMGIDALVYIPQDSKGARTICKACKDAGIYVINVDNVIQEDDNDVVDCVIASDNIGLGNLSGEWVANNYPDGANVLIAHLQTAESCFINVEGFWKGIESVKGSLDGYNEVATVEGGGATDVTFEAVSDALQAYDNIDVIYCINDTSAAGAIQAVEEAGKTGEIAVIGKDAAPIGKHAISEGKQVQSSGQRPTYMGYTAVQYAKKLIAGEKVEFNTAVEAYNVDSSNIKDFDLDSWDTLD